MSLQQAAIAANRFGLGATPDLLKEIEGDPRGWLLAQLDREVPLPDPIAALPPTGSDQIAFAMWTSALRQRVGGDDVLGARIGVEGARRAERPAGARPGMMNSGGADMEGDDAQSTMLARSYGTLLGDRYMRAVKARFDTAVSTDQPFRERLVHFWSNHFVVSAAKPSAIAMPPSWERDVARAHVAHSFEDMLIESSMHPAMQFYLDNFTSIGPNSDWGQNPEKVPYISEVIGRPEGLNENLAREILELHTVGVDGGYTQKDVTDFAKIITGWGIDLTGTRRVGPRRLAQMSARELFHFNAAAHEPGPQTVMGKTYDGEGVEQGLAVLRDLAVHPNTAGFIATKLVRYFIADEPPAAAVERVRKAFLDSEGDLPTVYRALVDSPEAWDPELRKMKRPEEYLISTVRAMEGPELEGVHVSRLLEQMGEQPWRQPGPDGWPDRAEFWTGADALWKRLEWATTAAESQATTKTDPAALAGAVLGPLASEKTITEIRRAESPEQGLALLLVSAEMLRR